MNRVIDRNGMDPQNATRLTQIFLSFQIIKMPILDRFRCDPIKQFSKCFYCIIYAIQIEISTRFLPATNHIEAVATDLLNTHNIIKRISL